MMALSSSNRIKRPSIAMACIFLLLTLLLATVPQAPALDLSLRVQSELRVLAAAHPATRVNVIVQELMDANNVEAIVARLGGTISKDLHIIHAFAAEMPASAALELARTDGVRWISLDAPTRSSAMTSNTAFTSWATQIAAPTSASIASNFNSTPISQGNSIWFSSSVAVSGLGSSPVTVTYDNAAIQFTANGTDYDLIVPPAVITFDPAAVRVTSSYDAVNDMWVTTVPSKVGGDKFLSGLTFQVPVDLPGGIGPVTWSGRFVTDSPGVKVSWKWAAAVYANLASDYNSLGIKPCDDSKASIYLNSDQAGTPETHKLFVIGGARGGGGSNYTGGATTSQTLTPAVVFKDSAAIVDAPSGPNVTFGYGSAVTSAFSGFAAEVMPGNVINRVEVVLRTYVPAPLSSAADPKLTVSVGGQAGASVILNHHTLDPYVGAAHAGTISVDITATRPWQWADFDDLQLIIDQSKLTSTDLIYYDAVGLRVTSSPSTGGSMDVGVTNLPRAPISLGKLANVYNRVVRATDVWNESPAYLQGQGVTVAVVDSGIFKSEDLSKRVVASANFDAAYHDSIDGYGHGTFVAGIIAGDGKKSGGARIGIAPKTNILNVRVSDDQGMAAESDVVAALQWIYEHKSTYNIRVVNLSLNSSVAQSYHTSPLAAASEILWFNGIVVVVSAGNNGTTTLYAPANDPFVITVGATDDNGTATLLDDAVASFSAYGTIEGGITKPDLVAPGRNIIAPLPANDKLTIGREHKINRVNKNYFRLSGTSMAAPMVSGAVALLLQDEPNLNPDQVKYRLLVTANKQWLGYDPFRAGAGYLDIYAAVHSTTTAAANSGIPVSSLLTTGPDSVLGPSVSWSSVSWSSVSWSSVSWSSVSWSSVSWSSVSWSSDYWEP
jgi:serine protease AprX